MFKRIKSKYLKFFLVLVIIAAVVFGILSITWVVYYNNKVKPLMNCLDNYEMDFVDYEEESSVTRYSFADKDNSDLSYDLTVPDFLEFFSDVQVITPCVSELDPKTGEITRITDYTYYFCYIAKPFSDGYYSLRIDDYTNSVDSYDDGRYDTSGTSERYHFEVDKNMNLISGDKAMFEEHYDKLKYVFDKTKEVFGEDAFK